MRVTVALIVLSACRKAELDRISDGGQVRLSNPTVTVEDVEAWCYVQYCNAHGDISQMVCGGECKFEDAEKCRDHWETTGRNVAGAKADPTACAKEGSEIMEAEEDNTGVNNTVDDFGLPSTDIVIDGTEWRGFNMTLMNKIRDTVLRYSLPHSVMNNKTSYNSDGTWNGKFYSDLASPYQLRNKMEHNNMSSLPKVMEKFLKGLDMDDVTKFFIDEAPSSPERPPHKHFLLKREVEDMLAWVHALLVERDKLYAKKYADIDPDLFRAARLQKEMEIFGAGIKPTMRALTRELDTSTDWLTRRTSAVIENMSKPLEELREEMGGHVFPKIKSQLLALKRLNASTTINARQMNGVLAQMFNVSDIAFDQNLNNSQESYGKQTMEIVNQWFKDFRKNLHVLSEQVDFDTDHVFDAISQKILDLHEGEQWAWDDYYLSVLKNMQEMNFKQSFQAAMIRLYEKRFPKLKRIAENINHGMEHRKDAFLNVSDVAIKKLDTDLRTFAYQFLASHEKEFHAQFNPMANASKLAIKAFAATDMDELDNKLNFTQRIKSAVRKLNREVAHEAFKVRQKIELNNHKIRSTEYAHSPRALLTKLLHLIDEVKAPQLKESIQSGLAQSRRMLKWHTQFVASKIQIALENRDKQQKKALRSVEHQVFSGLEGLLDLVRQAYIRGKLDDDHGNYDQPDAIQVPDFQSMVLSDEIGSFAQISESTRTASAAVQVAEARAREAEQLAGELRAARRGVPPAPGGAAAEAERPLLERAPEAAAWARAAARTAEGVQRLAALQLKAAKARALRGPASKFIDAQRRLMAKMPVLLQRAEAAKKGQAKISEAATAMEMSMARLVREDASRAASDGRRDRRVLEIDRALAAANAGVANAPLLRKRSPRSEERIELPAK